MDTLRGIWDSPSSGDSEGSDYSHDIVEDEIGAEAPPPALSQDERRMQVRAYNFWTSLLDNRNLPRIEDLDPATLPDFGPFSVLLDFTSGIENPGITYLGGALAEECEAEGHAISRLSDVPARSLLSRITDHYMQILANQAPIGFEAEFVNAHDVTVMYRGILLPFSSDDETIDFIYGVINWKEVADQKTADELLLEIDQALEESLATVRAPRDAGTMADWADGPLGGNPVEEQGEPANDVELGPDPVVPSLAPSVSFDMFEAEERILGSFDGPAEDAETPKELADDNAPTDALGRAESAEWLTPARAIAPQALPTGSPRRVTWRRPPAPARTAAVPRSMPRSAAPTISHSPPPPTRRALPNCSMMPG